MNLHLLFGMSSQAGMLAIVSYQSPGPRTRSCQSDANLSHHAPNKPVVKKTLLDAANHNS